MDFRLRPICALLLIASLIISGVGVSHAGISKGGAEAASHIHADLSGIGGSEAPGQSQKHCPENSKANSGALGSSHGDMSHGDMGNCCHGTVSPSLAAKDKFHLTIRDFDTQQFQISVERFVRSFIGEGPLRPPRANP